MSPVVSDVPPTDDGWPFELATASYVRFDPATGTPVQTSNGRPKFRLSFDLAYAAVEVYPPWVLVAERDRLTREAFEEAYREHLDRVGVDRLAYRFTGLAAAGGDRRLVLLCFEKLESGAWCHRTMFAQWWAAQTGQPVRELGPMGPPLPEPTLF